MKKNILFIVFIAVVFGFTQLNAQAFNWNIINNLKNITQTSNVQKTSNVNTLNKIDNQISVINNQTLNSFLSIVSLLSTQQESNTIQSKLNSIINKANTTEIDKTSLITQIIASYADKLANNETDIKSIILNMSAEEKKNLINAVASFAKNSSKYVNLAKNYGSVTAKLAKASSDISEVSTIISNAKKTAEILSNSAITVSGLASSISGLLN